MTTFGKWLRTTTITLIIIAVTALAAVGVTALIDPAIVRGSMGGGIARFGMELVGGGKGFLFTRRDANHPGLERSPSATSDARPIGAPQDTAGPTSNAANDR